MANPFPFTAGQVLTAAQMNGIGESTTFTPTWTNLTVGNGTQSFRYVRVQNFIYVQGKITLGSTSSVTGNVSFTLPVATTVQSDVGVVGQTYLADSGVGAFSGTVVFTGTSLYMQIFNVAATYPTITAFTASVPFTWSTNDYISMQAAYQVA